MTLLDPTPSNDSALPWTAHDALDAESFKALARKWASTVTVVTGRHRDQSLDGFTATAFLTVSMSPPIVLVSATKSTRAGAMARACESFTINILREDQRDLAEQFARVGQDRSSAFERFAHERDPLGAAVLHGTLGAFSCTRRQLVDAGDHVLLLADVTRIWVGRDDSSALLYADRTFRRLGDEVK
jgi:flavin reductase (DIM6/NTAB) family NADH-FMN oxidoreductase RutF